MAFVVKAEIADPAAERFRFEAHKTMYGGRRVAVGDLVFLFASETQGGSGLVARGTASAAVLEPRIADVERQTPRVTLEVRRTAAAVRPLGRSLLKGFTCWGDGRPETELNFKLYRQATNKIVGISAGATQFLNGFFDAP